MQTGFCKLGTGFAAETVLTSMLMILPAMWWPWTLWITYTNLRYWRGLW